MGKHNVSVIVQAKDRASRQFKTIGKSAFGMGSAIKKAAAMAAVYFGTRQLYRIGKDLVSVAAEQEEANYLLAKSLQLAGDSSVETYEKFKKLASGIQAETRFGDEMLQQQMSLAVNLGVTTDKLEEATKGAIGLSAVMNGKMGLPDSMKNVALAMQGEFTMLNRYLPALRSAETETEKMAILQKKMAEGYELAKDAALRGKGPLEQWKNIWGDIKEIVGSPVLAVAQEQAKKLSSWFGDADNQAKIGHWANKVVSGVLMVKDVFWDLLKFLRKDWKTGIGWVFDSFISLLGATFESAVTLAIAGGKGIWKGVKEGLLGGKEQGINRRAMEMFMDKGGQVYARDETKSIASQLAMEQGHGGLHSPELYEIRDDLFKEVDLGGAPNSDKWIEKSQIDMFQAAKESAKKEEMAKKVESILGGSIEAVTLSFKDAFAEIGESMPPDMKEAWEKRKAEYAKRIKELNAPFTPPADGGLLGGGGVDLGGGMNANSLANLMRGGRANLQARESRFLTMRAGSTIDYDKQIASEASKQTNLLQRLLNRSERLNQALLRNQQMGGSNSLGVLEMAVIT